MADGFLHGVEVLQIDDGLRPLSAPSTSVIGLVGTAPYADAAAFPLDTPVTITRASQAAALTKTMPANAAAGAEGSLPPAIADIFDQAKAPVVVVRVAADADLADQLGLVTGAQAEKTGVYALLASPLRPKILVATGFTHQEPGGDANPVSAALKATAARLRAVAVADGPNDTNEAAIAKAAREGGERLYIVDPHVRRLVRGVITTRPASALVAGVIARTDQQLGYWHSPSNKAIEGVLGLGRPVEFSLSDPATDANLLNEAGVATIIAAGGFKLWGNRTAESDPAWSFLAQRRTMDTVYDAIESGYLWAMDRPMSPQLVVDVMDGLEAFGRQLVARGALLGMKVYLDPELNDVAALKAGHIWVDFDAEPPPPLERLTVRAHRNDGYYEEVVDAVLRTLNAA